MLFSNIKQRVIYRQKCINVHDTQQNISQWCEDTVSKVHPTMMCIMWCSLKYSLAKTDLHITIMKGTNCSAKGWNKISRITYSDNRYIWIFATKFVHSVVTIRYVLYWKRQKYRDTSMFYSSNPLPFRQTRRHRHRHIHIHTHAKHTHYMHPIPSTDRNVVA